MKRVTGKVALVAGAEGGIGGTTAKGLTRASYTAPEAPRAKEALIPRRPKPHVRCGVTFPIRLNASLISLRIASPRRLLCL